MSQHLKDEQDVEKASVQDVTFNTGVEIEADQQLHRGLVSLELVFPLTDPSADPTSPLLPLACRLKARHVQMISIGVGL